MIKRVFERLTREVKLKIFGTNIEHLEINCQEKGRWAYNNVHIYKSITTPKRGGMMVILKGSMEIIIHR